jgi:hypothetical protein
VGNARGILENQLKGLKPEAYYRRTRVKKMDNVHGVNMKGRGPNNISADRYDGWVIETAGSLFEANSQRDTEKVRNLLCVMNRDTGFRGPENLSLMTTYPISAEHDLMDYSERRHRVMGMLTSGKKVVEMIGGPNELAVNYVISQIRKSFKPHQHLSFSLTVWDKDANPLPDKQVKKYFDALKKEFPKIDLRIVFREKGADLAIRVK